MRAGLITALIMAATLALPLQADPPVTVTQRVPIETLSPTGDIRAVMEAQPGTKLKFVSAGGSQLTLQDAQGVHYQIAAAATDYVPSPTAPASPPAIAAVPSIPTPKPVTLAPKAAAPNLAPIAPSSPPVIVQAPSLSDVLKVADIAEDDREPVAVWPPSGMPERPLLIAAHGHGGSGPSEISTWLDLAQQHKFTIVCPTFKSAVNTSFIPADTDYWEHLRLWIGDHLQYDHANVYMTGFSGGGYALWYLGTTDPDFIHGLFAQSCNFVGSAYGLDLSRWYRRPIEVIWGSNDLSDIAPSGQSALDMLRDLNCKHVVHVVVQGAGHQEHPDMVVSWMEQCAIDNTADNALN